MDGERFWPYPASQGVYRLLWPGAREYALGYWVVLRCHRIHDVTIISPRQEDTPFYKFGANTLLSVFWMDKQSGQFSIRRVWSVYDYPTDYLSYFDSLIAASALALDDQVVSVGDSFDRVPGLRRIPLSP